MFLLEKTEQHVGKGRTSAAGYQETKVRGGFERIWLIGEGFMFTDTVLSSIFRTWRYRDIQGYFRAGFREGFFLLVEASSYWNDEESWI